MDNLRNTTRGRRGHFRGRGRGRGRGTRDGFSDRDAFGDRPTLHPVPTIQQVIVGAPVSIVLKVDQPTGNEVQGFVAELLTRGNHPRGIKVRLQDGRVGRVQRMASTEAATASSAGLIGLGRNGETSDSMRHVQGNVKVVQRPPNPMPAQYTDYRFDGGEAPDQPELSLTDYIVTKPKGKKGKKNHQETPIANGQLSEQPNSVCPVCGEFEGDEAAVAHHVDSHFQE